jgi:hypothetical protein
LSASTIAMGSKSPIACIMCLVTNIIKGQAGEESNLPESRTPEPSPPAPPSHPVYRADAAASRPDALP